MGAGKDILNAVRHRIRRSGTVYEGRPVDVFVNSGGAGDDNPADLPPELLWRTQPHLRTVVDFLCRNMAQLGLHVFVSDGEDRERDRTSEVARVLARPNPHMTTYELIFATVGDMALQNRAYWFVVQGAEGMEIHPFPAHWVTVNYRGLNVVDGYTVWPPSSERAMTFDPDQVVAFPGWSPEPGEDSSPVQTLRLILEEQFHARKHRVQVWRRNGRIGSYLTRPQAAPSWDDSARSRFMEMFEAFTGPHGSRAGGTPLLEDGMELKRVGFSSADEQWSESVKLSLETVAQVYQVNPVMVGVLDAANYSNAKEFNRSLYTNTLGPDLRRLEQRLNAFVLPKLGAVEGQFVEFNVDEKLRGSFEEEAAVMTRAIGGPWMTRNEGRKMKNLPAVEGGDELITPLNVTEGGQSSPGDGGADTGTQDDAKAREVIAKHADRWSRIFTAKGFDMARADRELTADLESAGCDGSIAHEVNTRLMDSLEEGRVIEP